MILLIDNHDSFVYNLARYVTELGFESKVVRNNAVSLQEIKEMNPSHIILSPGPCTPDEAGITLEVITTFMATYPILGICLGHQAIGQALGGKVIRASVPLHGKSTPVHHNGEGLFKGLPNPLQVARYHSLVVEKTSLPSQLNIQATSPEGEIMAFRHSHLPLFGLQFHPESILTEFGHTLLKHFMTIEDCSI